MFDVAELGRPAELALADRARVRVEERDQPIADRLSGQALADLLDDLLAALGQRLHSLRAREDPRRLVPRLLLPRALKRLCPRARLGGERSASFTEAASKLPVSPMSASTSAFAAPVRRRRLRPIARSRFPAARERSRTSPPDSGSESPAAPCRSPAGKARPLSPTPADGSASSPSTRPAPPRRGGSSRSGADARSRKPRASAFRSPSRNGARAPSTARRSASGSSRGRAPSPSAHERPPPCPSAHLKNTRL